MPPEDRDATPDARRLWMLTDLRDKSTHYQPPPGMTAVSTDTFGGGDVDSRGQTFHAIDHSYSMILYLHSK
jgi:hypothetical protein